MKKRANSASFRRQMRQSMDELRGIMERGESATGDGKFTARTVEVIEPGQHDAKSIRRARHALKLSQVLFARLLGVSPALVRAWELGTRSPAPIARRLLDEVHAAPQRFAMLVRNPNEPPPSRKRVE